MLLTNLISSKKKIFATILMALVFIFSQATIGISTSGAANGTAKIFIIEFVIFALGLYTVFWRLIIKRELSKFSIWVKYYFTLLFTFGIFYIATFIYRYMTHMTLVSSFLLARIIIEVCIVAISLAYFKIRFQEIFTALLLGNLVSVLFQYGIIFFGVGEIRLGNHNLLGNSITSYICLLMFYPVLVYCISRKKDIFYTVTTWSLLALSIPTLLLAGSRIAFSVGMFEIVISLFAVILLKKIELKKFWQLLGTFAGIIVVSLGLVGVLASPVNKQNLVRSVDVPVNVYNKVVPNAMKFDVHGLFAPKDLSKSEKKKENKKKRAEDAEKSIKLSNYMRIIINDKAKKQINANPRNFLVGIGMSSVYTKNWGYQKPHNLVLLYLLPFGLIGTIICYLILLGPILLLFIERVNLTKTALVMMLLTYFPTLVVSLNQPTLGTLITCLSIITLATATTLIDKN
ncbi:hypothetical protein A4W83_08055 [Latilactobacillus sakei]|uniref:hypothetical protein n=1 Tax=Latilactobacillus sakei TaxID=1599 RepID=UPI000506AC98|nr:hypothetical protein [Latilactobacillus sakei]KGB15513.1 hypothetical protein KY41_00780 [Latilactobacillus sakei]USG08493.1 hypothetical protein A4W83_08055 [Latilactobacillus sakei]USG12169.1 hypothetical protein A4W85_08045 [Latilactobacillus sakei]